MKLAIQIDRRDNVAMVTSPVEAGDEVRVTETGAVVRASEAIKTGHKLALTRLEAGETVIKYGIPIGRMLSPVGAGGWISTHNLEDTTEELCGKYCQEFRDGVRTVRPQHDVKSSVRTIMAYPRKNGTFGIRNYVMVIPVTPECNAAAEAISDRTGCAWFVCDRTRLEGGRLTEYTKKAMIHTGRNPNIYAVLVLAPETGESYGREIFGAIAETGKPVRYLTACPDISEGASIIEGFLREADALRREPVSMEGFGLAVHCSGSDWTTEINGNAAVGAASDLIVEHGGRVFMTEWPEWSGSGHVMAEKCATRELAIELLDTLDAVRATVLRETGRPVEYMNPAPGNKEAGLTTLVEKSTGTIRKIGSTPIQGLLDYCGQPTGRGVWLPKHDSVWSPSTAIYASFSGAHMSVLNTGIGYLYFELPYMPCIRTTGNPETYANDALRLDFNAGIAFESKPIDEVGNQLFEYLLRVAEGEEPKAETDSNRAFHMYYYTENEFGEDIDRSRLLPVSVFNYHEQTRLLTELVK